MKTLLALCTLAVLALILSAGNVERYRAHCERLEWETGTPTTYSEDLKKCVSSSPLKIYLPILN